MAIITANSAINIVFDIIKADIDPNATVSRKTGSPVIHYTVNNGQFFKGNTPFRAIRKLDDGQARAICADLGFTHDNTIA